MREVQRRRRRRIRRRRRRVSKKSENTHTHTHIIAMVSWTFFRAIIAYVVMTTVYSIWTSFLETRSLVKEHFHLYEAPDILCRYSPPLRALQEVCNQAAKTNVLGYWYTVFTETMARTRWCLGWMCADVVKDASSMAWWGALVLSVFAWQFGAPRLFRKWMNSPNRTQVAVRREIAALGIQNR